MMSTPCDSEQICAEPDSYDQRVTIRYSALPAITRTTPANHVPEILQQQHFGNTSTSPADCRHMSNFIRQNEVNMINEPLKVQQLLLKSSSEMDK